MSTHSFKLSLKVYPLGFGLLPLVLTGCISGGAEKSVVRNVPDHEEAYAETLRRLSRTTTLYDNFETRFSISTTYLSPDFYAKMNERHKEIYQTSDEALSQDATKLGFFVTFYSSSSDRMRLDLPEEWNISLKVGKSVEGIRPLFIKKIREKAKFKLFFPAIHSWSREFLILFDQAPLSLSDKLVEEQSLELTIAGTQGQALLKWP